MIDQRARKRRGAISAALVLGAVCLLAMSVNWLKLPSLWGDASIGLLEGQRVAQGQLVYRDFALRYPPLSTLLLGLVFWLFGDTFTTAQVVYNLLSLPVVFLAWLAARRVLPAVLALAVAAVIAAQGGNQYLGTGYGWWPPDQAHSGYLVPCHFPRIPWYADQPAYPFDTPLPVVEFVRSEYEPQAAAGDQVMWRPAR